MESGSAYIPQEQLKQFMKYGFITSAIAGLASTTYAVYSFYKLLVPSMVISIYLISPGLALFGIGLYTPLFACIGWRGVSRGSGRDIIVCRLAMWILMVISMASALFIGATTAFSKGSAEIIHKAIVSYHDNPYMENMINMAQRHLECCGLADMYDWNDNNRFFCDDCNGDYAKCSLPTSCCVVEGNKVPVTCGRNMLNDSMYSDTARQGRVYMKGCWSIIDNNFYTTYLELQLFTLLLLACQIFIWGTAKRSNQPEKEQNQLDFNDPEEEKIIVDDCQND